jgi:hypothetical protein
MTCAVKSGWKGGNRRLSIPHSEVSWRILQNHYSDVPEFLVEFRCLWSTIELEWKPKWHLKGRR